MPAHHYRFFHGSELIGTSAMEYSDPEMGVRGGKFLVASGYTSLAPFFQAFMEARHEKETGLSYPEQQAVFHERIRGFQQELEALHLRMETPSGEVVETSCIDILDASMELEIDREVWVIVADYSRIFGDEDSPTDAT